MKQKTLTAAELAAMDPDQFLLANTMDGPPILEDRGAKNAPGTIYLANDTTRFDQAYYSQPLTAYATGWTDDDKVDQLLDFIAPVVPVSRRFEWSRWPNPEAFQSEADDIRALGSDFKRVQFTQEKVQDRVYNKGLTIRVDLDEWAEVPNWKERFTGYLLKRIVRNDARRAFTALAAASTNTAKTWSTGATDKDPDVDVITEVDKFGNVMGLNANRVLYGFTAWLYRLQGYGQQATASAFGGRSLQTPEALANMLGVDKVFVSKERYTDSATTKAKIVTTNVVTIFRASDGMMRDDPSSFKRFVYMVGGQKYRVFEAMVPPGKFWDITVEHYSNVVKTGAFSTYDGLMKLTIS